MTKTLLRSGVEWLREKIDTAAGEAVLYICGQKHWHIRVVPLMNQSEVVTEEELKQSLVRMDFMVSQAVLDANGIVPHPGDRIGFDGRVYELLPQPMSPVEEPHESLSLMKKLHTKLVEA